VPRRQSTSKIIVCVIMRDGPTYNFGVLIMDGETTIKTVECPIIRIMAAVKMGRCRCLQVSHA
jgi:hypothetical protein